jgi:uncharacterized protein YdeI (YjbR/CyaY-like superfamily)
MDDAERVHAENVAAWRAWLAAHHGSAAGVWLVSWKSATGRPRLSYDDAVEQALCFGWVDSKGRTLDDERSMLWFTPRRPGSGWSRSNKQRVGRLTAAGMMTEAGLRVVAAARADGSWTVLDAVEDGLVPADLAAALADRPDARAHFDAFPRSVRRAILEWIATAKRPQTRARRVAETAERAARNERANQWRRR